MDSNSDSIQLENLPSRSFYSSRTRFSHQRSLTQVYLD
jgi:hypothetical protein